MKLAILSDNHCQYDFEVPEADVLIHCGDFSFMGKPDEMIDFRDWIARQPHTHKLFIWGNHEKIDQQELYWREFMEETGAVCLHNTQHTIDGINFFGSSYTPVFGSWGFMANTVVRERHWKIAPTDVDVLVTHGPPKDVLSNNVYGEDCGCEHLKDYVLRYRPRIHAFGHIHEAAGVQIDEDLGVTYVNASLLNEKYEMVNKPIIQEIY